MEQIIKKLLVECGYEEKTIGISFYSKEDKSFFFLVNIPEVDFILLKNKELIRDNQLYKDVMDGFNAIINGGEQITIEKNSSLIILVKCANINAIENLQQQILLFEEDPYFFKKYVIMYTDDSIMGLTVSPLLPELRTKVNNNERFNQFATSGYRSEIAEYLVILQLFIKLPFLNLDHGTEGFTSLSQKITTILGIQLSMYTSLLQNFEGLTQVDFIKPEDEDRINELFSILLHD